MSTCVVIIPARYASSRFPGKPLVSIAGRPMIQHVYERARQARLVDAVLVATDDARIVAAVEAFGGQAVMTSSTHPSGTDRIAEVAAQRPYDIVVNVQGDEPCIAPLAIDAMIAPLRDDATVAITTLAHALRDVADLLTPHVVKVVVDRQGDALYFSRAPIPYDRQAWPQAPQVLAAAGTPLTLPPGCYRHLGLYAYRRDVLLQLARLPQTTLEQVEQLEQLRALEHGYRLRVVQTMYESVGVDTPEDVRRAEQILGHAGAAVEGISARQEKEQRC
jgi:3-deoxy-manno-octulosonate cytidylyltransferase (CMP-KDO synthetase)